jgi:hypothetical protein
MHCTRLRALEIKSAAQEMITGLQASRADRKTVLFKQEPVKRSFGGKLIFVASEL